MIKKIEINDAATIKDTKITPGKINFIYGGNGTGKTTISKIIKGDFDLNKARIYWDNDKPLDVFVYNSDFVKLNFSAEVNIPGIFTLGTESIEAKKFIEEKRLERDQNQKVFDDFKTSEDYLSTQLGENLDPFIIVCWDVKKKYSDKFIHIFKGFTRNKSVFAEKCIKEFKSISKDSKLKTLDEIEALYNLAFNDNLIHLDHFNSINITEVENIENFSLLSKIVKGKSDTDIGKFIEYLDISDWVKKGTQLIDKAAGKCPYCQRNLPLNVKEEIENYFDKSYEDDCKKLKDYKENYNSYFLGLFDKINMIINSDIEMFHFEDLLHIYKESFAIFNENILLLQNKIDSPSQVIEISTLCPFFEKMNEILLEFNTFIDKNNETVEHKQEKQESCKQLCWIFLINTIKNQIKIYITKEKGIKAGLESLKQKKKDIKVIIDEINIKINKKEETLTSVKPTVKAINRILKNFGFNGFLIGENTELKGTYYIKRPDGTNVNDTLSEGEYNFITFIYFYQLIHGSQISKNTNTDRIIVIDDPVSSLDSMSLFIISTLIRNIKNDCVESKNGIKQVFIFTHNVYFHKEVTFEGSKRHNNSENIIYWRLKKREEVTSVEVSKENKIFTSYDLLWEVIRDENSSKVSIFNTIRRILEYYFNVIGGINYEKCIDQFEGEEKVICKSLLSCINEESHIINDDFSMCFDGDNIDKCLKVFKSIFTKLNQENHYDMMMNRIKN